jgi:hypothetical protein
MGERRIVRRVVGERGEEWKRSLERDEIGIGIRGRLEGK